jgi:hypothetical protein
MNPSTPDPLDELLKASRRDVTLPPRFQAEVWQRIADRETASPWAALREKLEEWSQLLTRPRYAGAMVAAVMLLSAGAATVQGLTSSYTSGSMQARYVSMIDPYSNLSHSN